MKNHIWYKGEWLTYETPDDLNQEEIFLCIHEQFFVPLIEEARKGEFVSEEEAYEVLFGKQEDRE